jgi:hypothetical protein
MKICTKCNTEKQETAFRFIKDRQRFSCRCLDCLNEQRRQKRNTHPDTLAKRAAKAAKSRKPKKKWGEYPVEQRTAWVKKYKLDNKETIAEQNKKYVEQNREIRKATMHNYRQKTKALQAEYVRRRQAAKLQRTPKWLTEDDVWVMREAYKLAKMRTEIFGFSWHVDHVLPLQGTIISGLHVPTNLQVIPWIENVRKHNKVTQ